MEIKNKIKLRENVSEQRFEMEFNLTLAHVEYIWQRGNLYLLKTTADEELVRSGKIEILYQAILEHVKNEKITIVVNCKTFDRFITNSNQLTL